jgi:hypothetical protein
VLQTSRFTMLAVVPEEHPRLSLCHRLVAATLPVAFVLCPCSRAIMCRAVWKSLTVIVPEELSLSISEGELSIPRLPPSIAPVYPLHVA